jgi:hypothetical protein
MATKIEEAIDQEKRLSIATLLGPGPLGVAIFVFQPGDDDEESDETDETDESSEIGSEMSIDKDQNISTANFGARGRDAEALVLDEGCYFTHSRPFSLSNGTSRVSITMISTSMFLLKSIVALGCAMDGLLDFIQGGRSRGCVSSVVVLHALLYFLGRPRCEICDGSIHCLFNNKYTRV